jgi:hypothetical protein
MKKFIVLGLFGLLIMAFSATAYTQPKLEFKASGALEATSWLYRNVACGDAGQNITSWWAAAGNPSVGFWPKDPAFAAATWGAYNRTNSYMEYRGILRFDAIMGKELSGTVIFEMDSNRWGDQSVAGDNRNRTGFWTGDRNSVEIKNLYIDFALPYLGIPAPMTVRVGLQPLGVRPHMFMITDGMGVTSGIKFDPVLIGLTWAKAWEGLDARADDVNIYGFNINAKIGPVTPGFFAYNFNMDSYPIPNGANPTAYGTYNAPTSANMWWLGLYLDGKLGPLNLNFDVVWDTGSVKPRDGVFGFAVPNVKYSGWATQFKLEYPWEKFNFGGLFMYASGADQRKTSRNGLPGTAVADGAGAPGAITRKVGSYVIPPGSEEWAAWGESLILSNNYITATATPVGMWPSLTQYGTQMTRGAIGGTWVLKFFAGFKPISWYKVTFQGMYIGDTTSHGNTLGDAVKSGTAILRDDKTIGWELDLIQDIQIYNNLKWSIGLGYMFAGKALDQWGPNVINDSPKNPWILATKLRYDF